MIERKVSVGFRSKLVMMVMMRKVWSGSSRMFDIFGSNVVSTKWGHGDDSEGGRKWVIVECFCLIWVECGISETESWWWQGRPGVNR